VKVVAIADTHGTLPAPSQIPPCDVLLHCGDIAPEFDSRIGYDPDLMRARQMEWLRDDYALWEEQVPAKYILGTPGNHDWFSHMSAVNRTQLFVDAGITVKGKTFWFTPWIAPRGPWNYQLDRAGRKSRYFDIPKNLHVLVSHAPAHRVMDMTYTREESGCPELRQAILNKRPHHFCFGHIHEGQRWGREKDLGRTKCHHASLFLYNKDWKPIEFEI
jgi:Icc-related predicted phosphoesterase